MPKTLTIATVLKPQGIRGEIKVKALTDSAEDLKNFPRVFIDGVEYKVLSVRPAGDCAFLSLRGIADRNAAELLRGKDVIALREDAPELPEDTFYLVDVLGCEVVTEKGKSIGTICDITPAKTDIDAGGYFTFKFRISFAEGGVQPHIALFTQRLYKGGGGTDTAGSYAAGSHGRTFAIETGHKIYIFFIGASEVERNFNKDETVKFRPPGRNAITLFQRSKQTGYGIAIH